MDEISGGPGEQVAATASSGRRAGMFFPQGSPAVAYGPGALDRLPEALDAIGVQRVLLVSTRSLAAEGDILAGVARRLGDRMGGTYVGSRQHTPDWTVADGVAALRSAGADGLVSVGGGSAVDTAKGIALAATAGDDLSRFFATVVRQPDGTARMRRGAHHDELAGFGRLPRPPDGATAPWPLPHVAVPTTLSGAEYTDHAGITTSATGRKEQVYHPRLVPAVVILDPTATAATPGELWLSTGIKILDHAVEILYSPGTSAPSEALCLGALRRVARHLADSADPAALGARAEIQVAAWLAVAGYPNQAAGISHAVDHQLGGACDVPHGIGACCLLPQAMRFNRRAAAPAFARMAEAIGLPVAPDGDAAGAVIDAVEALVAALGLPGRLRDVGVPREALRRVAELALTDAAIAGNPRPVHDADEILTEVLEPAW